MRTRAQAGYYNVLQVPILYIYVRYKYERVYCTRTPRHDACIYVPIRYIYTYACVLQNLLPTRSRTGWAWWSAAAATAAVGRSVGRLTSRTRARNKYTTAAAATARTPTAHVRYYTAVYARTRPSTLGSRNIFAEKRHLARPGDKSCVRSVYYTQQDRRNIRCVTPAVRPPVVIRHHHRHRRHAIHVDVSDRPTSASYALRPP